MLSLLQVCHKGPGSAHSKWIPVYCKSLETADFQLAPQLLLSRALHEGPLVERGHIVIRKLLFGRAEYVPFHHQLLRAERREQGGDVLDAALGHLEGARGYVQKGCAALLPVEVEAGEIVVFAALQHPLPEGYARGENLRDSTLHQLGFHEVGVFELVAYRHLVSGAHYFLEIGLKCVVGESGHLRAALVTV